MKDWETPEFKHLLEMFVGDAYGDNPIEKLDYIREEKKVSAQELIRILDINSASVVLEVGSGFGFESRVIAEKADKLHCFDISASFLEQAKRECEDLNNVTFNHIQQQPAQFQLEDQSVDLAFSSAVFIHLNLFDIYWYFSEFSRVIKPGGKVYFDVLSAGDIDMEKFEETAAHYKDNIECIRNLISWNSVPAIGKIAAHWSFDITPINEVRAGKQKHNFAGVDLLFTKR